jgi:prolipoprotein diacylglyceryltransferase
VSPRPTTRCYGRLGYPRAVPAALINLTPPSGIGIGPLTLGFYGIGYVLAVTVLILVSQSEARRKGFDPGLVTSAIVVVAIFALVGARLYHVIDQWSWGNFFNQELYGPPTDLPWGITIDCAHRIAQYPCTAFPFETTGFHPLFLYESVLTISGGFVALVLARRFTSHLLDGDLASFWMVWYGSVRIILELFREGWNWTFFGLPMAMLIGSGLIVIGIGSAWWRHAHAGDPLRGNGAAETAVPPPERDGASGRTR